MLTDSEINDDCQKFFKEITPCSVN